MFFFPCGMEKMATTTVDFFLWFYPPMCERSKQLIPELVIARNNMQNKVRMHQRRQKLMMLCLVLSWIFFLFVLLYEKNEK